MAVGEIITIVVSIIGCLLGITSFFRDPLAGYYGYMMAAINRYYGYMMAAKNRYCGYMMTAKNPCILLEKLEELSDLIASLDQQLRVAMADEQTRAEIQKRAEVAKIIFEINMHEKMSLNKEMSFRIRIFLCIYIPNIYSRFKYGRLIVGRIDQIDRLLNEGRKEEKKIMKLSEKLVGNKVNSAFRKMLMYMREDEVRIIGVHGMGGVGKTALVSEIITKLNHFHLYYDSVIWVNVPADGSDLESDLENIQLAIARNILLDLSGTANSLERAAELRNTLMQRRKCLLIVDDMWRGFSLEEIGIPEPTRKNGCKLIIISRYSSVCNTMKTDKNVELNLLLEDDGAWELFTIEFSFIHNDISVFPEEIQMAVKEVAKQCGGLPSIIIQVARNLRVIYYIEDSVICKIRLGEVATQIKESILNLLEAPYMVDVLSMVKATFDRLKISYDRLSSRTRSCFLYCALYPKGHYIGTKELIEYWRWEGLLSDEGSIEHTMQEAKNILHELKDVGFLESISEEGGIERIKVHPLIRDMAIYITKTTPKFLIKAGLGSRKPPLDNNNWPIYLQKASLMRNDLEDLSYEPNCPNLSSLLLQYNPFTGEFCDNFFHGMPNLKVLDLSYTGVHILPTSLSSLAEELVCFVLTKLSELN